MLSLNVAKKKANMLKHEMKNYWDVSEWPPSRPLEQISHSLLLESSPPPPPSPEYAIFTDILLSFFLINAYLCFLHLFHVHTIHLYFLFLCILHLESWVYGALCTSDGGNLSQGPDSSDSWGARTPVFSRPKYLISRFFLGSLSDKCPRSFHRRKKV